MTVRRWRLPRTRHSNLDSDDLGRSREIGGIDRIDELTEPAEAAAVRGEN
jgi:hypothetical protein